MFDNTADNDSFNFLDDAPTSPAEALEPPADLLTSQQVQSVRFLARNKGYDYRQVEEFVARVNTSIEFYQDALKTIEASYHELAEDSAYKDEKITQLKSTIEVFRAKGDPMVSNSGEYVTESVIRESDMYQRLVNENTELKTALAALQDQLHEAQSALTAVEVSDDVVEPMLAVEEHVAVPEIEDEDTSVPEIIVDSLDSSEPQVESVSPNSLLAFAPEAAGYDLSKVPVEDVEVIERRSSLDDAPEAKR